MKKYLLICLIMILSGCASSTKNSTVGVNRSQFFAVSSAQMDEGSKQAYDEIISKAKKEGKLNKNTAQTKRVKDIANKLIAKAPHFRDDAKDWDWQVNVIDSDEINAWCMPNGRIVVYTGIINSLNLTDGELAAILGHEISHALREHSREQASREMIKSVGLGALSQFGVIGSGTASLADMVATYTISLPYSRDNEREADRMGTELMSLAGYNPKDAVSVWEKMNKLGGSQMEFLSTHPSNDNRIKDLQNVANQLKSN